MNKERELIKDMKILLECTYSGGLQRNADVLIGRAIELLAQPEQEPRKPLSDDEIGILWETNFTSNVPYYVFDEICIVIEKAHGITGVDDE